MFIFYFFAVALHTICAYDLKKIESVNGTVKILEIDRDSNIYCVTDDSTFYKLNSNYELILSKQIKEIFKILITPLNYAWIITRDDIYLLKPNSTDINHASNYQQPDKAGCYKREFHMDSRGNLLYNSDYEGVAMMKYDATTPILIVNLENYFISENSFVVDEKNDTYMIVTTFRDGKCSDERAFIHSDDLNDLAPKASLHGGPNLNAKQNPLTMHPSFLSNFGDNLVLGYSGNHARLYISSKRFMYYMEILYSQPSFDYFNFHSVNDNFYFLGRNSASDCFLNVGNEIENSNTDANNSYSYPHPRIPHYTIRQIKLSERGLCAKDTKMIFDSEGTLFMASDERLYRINFGDDRLDVFYPFNDSGKISKILSLASDEDDNLWILAKKRELCVLRKGLSTIESVTNSTFVSDTGVLKINKYTGDVLIGCDKETSEGDTYDNHRRLYVVTK